MVNEPNESRESNELQQSLAELQRRLDRIERHLGMRIETAKPTSPQASTPPVISPSPPIQKTEPAHVPPTPPTAPPIALVPKAEVVHKQAQPARIVSPVKSTPAKPERGGIELMIAAKWFAWIGAIIIVLGSAFALREFGADLWSQLLPVTKCIIVAAFGFVLIAGGEIALRKLGRVASVGLFSAGLGVLYLDAYSTYQFFDPPLLTRGASFVLVGVVAMLGFLMTFRTRSLTIGVLSLLAGYLAPVLLGTPNEHVIETLLYLTLLLGIGLALSAASPRPFRALRYVSIVAHLIVAGGWMVLEGRAHWQFSLVFMSVWWAMVLGEATLAAMRRQSAIGNAVAVFIATACYVTAGCLILDGAIPAGTDWLGLYTVAVAIICIITAMQFGSGIAALRESPQFAIDKLAVALLVQSGALIAVAIALQFDDYGRSVSWLAVAVASIELGNRLRSRGLDVFGLILGTLALFMVATIDRFVSTALGTEIWRLDASRWNIFIDRWSLLVIGAIVITHLAAQRLRPGNGFWKAAPILASCVGTIYWLVLCLINADELATTTGWLLYAAALIALNGLNRKLHYLEQSFAVLLLTATRWIVIDAIGYRTHFGWNAEAVMPFVNGQLAVSALIAGGLLVVGALWPRRTAQIESSSNVLAPSLMTQRPSIASMLPAFASIVLFIGFSFEFERAVSLQQMHAAELSAWPISLLRAFWITMLWAICGSALLFIGSVRRAYTCLTVGYAIVIFSAIAWLTFETLGPASAHGVVDVPVILNIQFFTGIMCAITLAATAMLLHRKITDMQRHGSPANDVQSDHVLMMIAICLIGAIGLWLGSLEIARYFHGERMATQMGLSIYWGMYAVGFVVIGFIRRWPAARYVGLAMFGITVIKVLTIDLATVDKIWRVVSLMVTGLLAIGVSIGYVKLSPKLAAQRDDEIEKAGQYIDRP